jgi:hypothetical protein
MNLSTDVYAEICKQSAFISALVAGFSFAFLGALIISSNKSRVIDMLIAFSIISIAGFLVCALVWTLGASRMALYSGNDLQQVPQLFINLHRKLSVVFTLSFFFFLVTLGLSGWVRSYRLGIFSTIISVISLVFFFIIGSNFIG